MLYPSTKALNDQMRSQIHFLKGRETLIGHRSQSLAVNGLLLSCTTFSRECSYQYLIFQ